MIHGLVERPLVLTMEDIRRFPSESHIHFLECSGNPGFEAIRGKTASDLVRARQLRRVDGRSPGDSAAGGGAKTGGEMGHRRGAPTPLR